MLIGGYAVLLQCRHLHFRMNHQRNSLLSPRATCVFMWVCVRACVCLSVYLSVCMYACTLCLTYMQDLRNILARMLIKLRIPRKFFDVVKGQTVLILEYIG